MNRIKDEEGSYLEPVTGDQASDFMYCMKTVAFHRERLRVYHKKTPTLANHKPSQRSSSRRETLAPDYRVSESKSYQSENVKPRTVSGVFTAATYNDR